MISVAVMKKQVGRLLRLPFAPRDPADLKGLADEFTRVLTQSCRSDTHCTLVVDAVIDSATQVPAPADIRLKASTVESPDLKAPLGCPMCQGSGWQSFQRTVNGFPYDYADFCVCPLGSFIRSGEEWLKSQRKK